LKRGEIYTAATGHGFGSKPRPVVIVQGDDFCHMSKILVAPIGTPVDLDEDIRVAVAPDPGNGLKARSEIMIDTIMPVRVGNFGSYVGLLADSDIRRVDIALLTFLGFARPS
jgi:mRNA interferase MazF